MDTEPTLVGEDAQHVEMMDIGLDQAAWDAEYADFLRSEFSMSGLEVTNNLAHMHHEQLSLEAVVGSQDVGFDISSGLQSPPHSVFTDMSFGGDSASASQSMSRHFGSLQQLQNLQAASQKQRGVSGKPPSDAASGNSYLLANTEFHSLGLQQTLHQPFEVASTQIPSPTHPFGTYVNQSQQSQRGFHQLAAAGPREVVVDSNQDDWWSSDNHAASNSPLQGSCPADAGDLAEISELQAFQQQLNAQDQGPVEPHGVAQEARHRSLPVTVGMCLPDASKLQLLACQPMKKSKPASSPGSHTPDFLKSASQARTQNPQLEEQRARGHLPPQSPCRYGLPPKPPKQYHSLSTTALPTSLRLPPPGLATRHLMHSNGSSDYHTQESGHDPQATGDAMALSKHHRAIQPVQDLPQHRVEVHNTSNSMEVDKLHRNVGIPRESAAVQQCSQQQQQLQKQRQQQQLQKHQESFDQRLHAMVGKQQALKSKLFVHPRVEMQLAGNSNEAVRMASPFESAVIAPEGVAFAAKDRSVSANASNHMPLGPRSNSDEAAAASGQFAPSRKAHGVQQAGVAKHTSHTSRSSRTSLYAMAERENEAACLKRPAPMSEGNSDGSLNGFSGRRPTLQARRASPTSGSSGSSPLEPGSEIDPSLEASDGEVPAVRSALAATLKRNEALNKRNDSLEESLGLLSPLRIRWPGRHSPMPSAAISAAFLAPEKDASLFATAAEYQALSSRDATNDIFTTTSAALPVDRGLRPQTENCFNDANCRHRSLQLPQKKDPTGGGSGGQRHSDDEPIGFRRASAGSNLPPNAQVAGQQVLNPVVPPGEEWWLQVEMSRGVPPPIMGTVPEASPPRGALTFTLRPEVHLHLSPQQIAQLPWRNVCGLWQELVIALAHCLATCADKPGRRLPRLLLESGHLCAAVAAPGQSPSSKPVCFVAEGPALPFPQSERWRTIAASLLLTRSAAGQICALRLTFLKARGAMQQRRCKLLTAIRVDSEAAVAAVSCEITRVNNGNCDGKGKGNVNGRGNGKCNGSSTSNVAFNSASRPGVTIDLLSSLAAVLADERALCHHFRAVVWGRILTPVQAALATVQLYPWSCDVIAIAEAVAAEMGEPTLEQILSEGAAMV